LVILSDREPGRASNTGSLDIGDIMFGRKRSHVPDQTLDEIGREVIRAAALADEEAEAAVGSPFAFARLRARIESERPGEFDAIPVDLAERWTMTVLAARKAVPVLALVAAVATGLWWRIDHRPPVDSVSRIAGAPAIEIASIAPTACTISSKSECVVSIEEVLATMMDRKPEGESTK
jgi:hypothetical protein